MCIQLLRNPNTAPNLPPTATTDVHRCILRTAEAYEGASDTSNASTSAAHHARFLKGLIRRDIFESKEQEKLRGKRDNAVEPSHVRGSFPQIDARGPNVVPVNGFPDPHGVPPDQYAQYQQQSMMPQVASMSSQLPHSNPGYVYPSSAATSAADPAHAMPPGYQSGDHASGSMPCGSNSGLPNTYGYGSPHDPSVVPSQSHHTPSPPLGLSQSDVDYSRMMFRNIGVIGFDFYSMNQQQYPQRIQQGWMNPGMGGDTGYAGPSYSSTEYGYQQQRAYDGFQR